MSGTFPSLHSATLGSFSACETLWTVLYVLSLDDILTQFNLQMQKRGWVVAEPWLNAYTLAFCLLRYTESSWQGGSPFIKNLTPPADRGWNEALVSIQAPKACFKLDAVKKISCILNFLAEVCFQRFYWYAKLILKKTLLQKKNPQQLSSKRLQHTTQLCSWAAACLTLTDRLSVFVDTSGGELDSSPLPRFLRK